MRKGNRLLLVIAFAVTYLAFFADSDLTKLSTLLDFILTGAIATAFISMMLAVAKRA
ncbi:MAG: hypothetical protein HFJ18_03840 [Clostridia bacterium]|nr:hypothetical protein [Clostridia bacterium]